jgi:hypothetical protein
MYLFCAQINWSGAAGATGKQQWVAYTWTIWKERNSRIFQETEKNHHAMKAEISSNISQWAICKRASNRNSNYSLAQDFFILVNKK